MGPPNEIVAVSRARQRLPSMVREAAEEGRSFGLVRRGELEAVLLGAREFEGLLETLEILADPSLRARVRRGLREVEQGRLVSWSAARASWRKRHAKSGSRRPR